MKSELRVQTSTSERSEHRKLVNREMGFAASEGELICAHEWELKQLDCRRDKPSRHAPRRWLSLTAEVMLSVLCAVCLLACVCL